MKGFSILSRLILLLLAAGPFCPRAGAQSLFVSITNSPNPVAVNGTLTHTVTVTNLIGTAVNIFITNTMPPSVQFLGSVPVPFTTSSNSGSLEVVVNLGPLATLQGATASIATRPTVAGSLTNTFVVTALGQFVTAPSNVVTTVTGGAANTPANLAVSVRGPGVPVLVNDWVPFGISVTNRGAAASNVVLNAAFSPGVRLISANPNASLSPSNTFVFNLGNLAAGTNRTFTLRVEPTNSGPLTFTAAIVSTNVSSTNSSAGTNLTVGDLILGQLSATNVSGMAFDPQNSLMKQTIRLSNVSSSNAPAARVIVNGLTNWLYNAAGTNSLGALSLITNNPNPFVIYTAPLDPGQSVDLVMEYVVSNRQPFDVTDYVAVPMPGIDLTTPAGTNTAFAITLVTNTPLGHILIEFQSVTGRVYSVLYSTNSVDFLTAVPPITAQADRTQWIDDGPPKTVSRPADATSRLYRIRLEPP